ncbi:MAG: hypothetical protein H6979_02865 [Chromatiales bacterium]|nr:hypothetical protein [Chromatiales bacterium]
MKKALNDYRVDTRWHNNVVEHLQCFLDTAHKTFAKDPDGLKWIEAAIPTAHHALIGYARGEMSIEETLSVVNKLAQPCPPSARILLLGITADRALETKQRKLGESKPLIPRWLRAMCGEFVEKGMAEGGLSREDSIDSVLQLLNKWDLIDLLSRQPKESTLQEWHREWKKSNGVPMKRGRPRKCQ